jgi:hypothetical protein
VVMVFLSSCSDQSEVATYSECSSGVDFVRFKRSITNQKSDYIFNTLGVSIHSKPFPVGAGWEDFAKVTISAAGDVEFYYRGQDEAGEHFIVLDKACLERLEVFLKGYGVKTERTAQSELSINQQKEPQ